MREIKFRGKRVDNGVWVVGNLYLPNKLVSGVYICSDCTHVNFYPDLEDGDNINNYINTGIMLGGFFEVIPETVGQYTGLKDKEGREIYEGDVVKLDHWKSSDLFDYSKPFIVTYYEGEINFKQGEFNNFKGSLNGMLSIEVIGNIHDNKELLNK